MPDSLPYGYIKPASGDNSVSEWMPNNAANTERMASHSHDGNNSAAIYGYMLQKYTEDLISGVVTLTSQTYTASTIFNVTSTAGLAVGMWLKGADVAVSTQITDITGLTITVDVALTGAATGTGSIEFSNWETFDVSGDYRRTVTLPTGYVSRTAFIKFYYTASDEEVDLDVTVSAGVTFVITLTDNTLDITTVVL
jgi:hypothetical protein